MPFGGQLFRFREQVIRDVDGGTHDAMMTRFRIDDEEGDVIGRCAGQG